MRNELSILEVPNCRRWRTWLAEHHLSSPGVWLVFYKGHTGMELVAYDESVRQALCFGWIDSLIKRLDGDRYARKFTPRQGSSKWSPSNRQRWKELKSAGLLAPAGLAAAPMGNSYAARPAIPKLPSYIAKALRANAKAWDFFQALAPTYKSHFVMWIHSASRPETRQKRIRESLALLAAGRKLGLK